MSKSSSKWNTIGWCATWLGEVIVWNGKTDFSKLVRLICQPDYSETQITHKYKHPSSSKSHQNPTLTILPSTLGSSLDGLCTSTITGSICSERISIKCINIYSTTICSQSISIISICTSTITGSICSPRISIEYQYIDHHHLLGEYKLEISMSNISIASFRSERFSISIHIYITTIQLLGHHHHQVLHNSLTKDFSHFIITCWSKLRASLAMFY